MINLVPAAREKTENRRADFDIDGKPVFSGVSEDVSRVLADCVRFDTTGEAEVECEVLEHVEDYLLGLSPDFVDGKAEMLGELLEGSDTRAVRVPRAWFQVACD